MRLQKSNFTKILYRVNSYYMAMTSIDRFYFVNLIVNIIKKPYSQYVFHKLEKTIEEF